MAILTDAETRVRAAIRGAGLTDAGWCEQVRGGLWAILSLADSDPALARVCLVESGRAGGLVEMARERILTGLVGVVDEGRLHGKRAGVAGALTAEALIGAISAVLAARLGEQAASHGNGRRAPLRDLLGELMSMIVLPYLGPGAARRELARPLPKTVAVESHNVDVIAEADPLAGSSMRLTYRTARVLLAAAQLGEVRAGASNRQIAEHAGVADQGQISKLLSRLERHGLLTNAAKDSGARGEANRWMLTRIGQRLVRDIGFLEANRAERSAA